MVLPIRQRYKEANTQMSRLRFFDQCWDISNDADQPAENRRVLDWLIERYEIRSVLEVGSCIGSSARFFAKYSQIDTVVCVDSWRTLKGWPDEFGNPLEDPWPPGLSECFYGAFVDCLRDEGLWHKIVPVVGKSADVVDFVPIVDLVYVDGDHTYAGCSPDLRLYKKKARKIICGDDYHFRPNEIPEDYYVGMPANACPRTEHTICGCVPCYPGVVQAVKETFPQHWHGQRFWYAEIQS